MAKKTGSDELFRLIHSLSTEEKGYFKKFARRHAPQGSVYLQLFDAINKQQSFEESTLKKAFARYNYKDLKLYLKDMITDCMVLYYKNSHPHIRLFNQLQKIHFLLIKGLSQEALKAVEKALRQSDEMELFNVRAYLLRLQVDLKMAFANRPDDVRKWKAEYDTLANEALARESNLLSAELLNLSFFIKARSHQPNLGAADIEKDKETINTFTSKSKRAEIKKLNTLNYLYHIAGDLQGRYELSGKIARLSRNFYQLHDNSFNMVRPLCNYLVTCMDFGKIEEMEELRRQLESSEASIKLYPDVAFPMVNLSRVMSCYFTGQFKKGLAEIHKTEKDTLAALKNKSDYVAVNFQKLKLLLLFVNEKYRECWMELQQLCDDLKMDADSGAMMLEMMVQVEMGNFQLLPGMVKRAAKKLAQKNLMNEDYEALLHFFKHVTADNIRKTAVTTMALLKDYSKATPAARTDIFGLMQYHTWLKAKSANLTLAQVMVG